MTARRIAVTVGYRLDDYVTRLSLACVALLLACCGCASIQRLTGMKDDVGVKQELRMEDAVHDFEGKRDFAQYQAAQARWREGNLPACRETLGQLLERSPKFVEARVLLAQVLLCDEKFQPAEREINRALTEQPDSAFLHHMLGLAQEAQGKANVALASYQRATELEPANTTFSQAFQAVGGGRKSTVQNNNEEVGRALADAARAFEAGEPEQAYAWLAMAVAEEPASAGAAVRAGGLALQHGHPELAVQLLQPLSAQYASSAAFYRVLGTSYYRLADYRSAQVALEQALSLDNSSGLAYVLMGCTLEKLGQQTSAKAYFEEARRLDPRL